MQLSKNLNQIRDYPQFFCLDRESELVTIHGRRSGGTGAPPFTQLRKMAKRILVCLEISYLFIEQLFANMH